MNRRSFIDEAQGAVRKLNRDVKSIRSELSSAVSSASSVNSSTTRAGRRRVSTLGLDPYTAPLDYQHAAHLLRRTLFGPTHTEISAVVGQSAQGVVDQLVSDPPLPSPPVDFNQADAMFNQSWVQQQYNGRQEYSWEISLKAWWLGLMISQGLSLREKMTLFWHNHFSVQTSTVKDACYMYQYLDLLRRNAYGNFKVLTRSITTNPAMLVYLNGDTNTKASANENYGRELQELFTIGKGPEIAPGDYTYYTEADVKAASRVLTGWIDNRITLSSSFDPTKHDTTDKQFSAHYQNTVIKGQTGSAGANETDQLIDMIFNQNETARFICRKLYRWFVFSTIDDTIEQNIIGPLADTLISNSYEIGPVLKQLLGSQHFFDSSAAGFIGAMIKSPADFHAGLLRSLQATIPSGTVASYSSWNYVRGLMASNGMDLLDTPDVAGWKAYYIDPNYYQLWINTDTLPPRSSFATRVISANGIDSSSFQLIVDPLAYAASFPSPEDPNALLAGIISHMLGISLSATQTAYLKQVMLDQLPDYEWTAAWSLYTNDPTNVTNRNAVRDKLLLLLDAIARMAEYQVM